MIGLVSVEFGTAFLGQVVEVVVGGLLHVLGGEVVAEGLDEGGIDCVGLVPLGAEEVE